MTHAVQQLFLWPTWPPRAQRLRGAPPDQKKIAAFLLKTFMVTPPAKKYIGREGWKKNAWATSKVATHLPQKLAQHYPREVRVFPTAKL